MIRSRILICALTVPTLLSLAACAEADENAASEPWPRGDSIYVFDRPDAQYDLHDDLDEISGLALLEDGRLAAIEDERGVLYILDPQSGEVLEERRFAERGDYEAVEIAEGMLFVLRSDGRVHRFEDWSGSEITGDYFDLDIPRRCDAEGMRYDTVDRRLLVSCKDEPGPDLEREKAIYAFSLDGRKLAERPVYTINSRRFTASIDDHPVNQAVRSVLSERVDLSGFKPAELAFHPITGDIFIVSSVRESLISMARDGTVTGVWPLPDRLLEQPEGLVFLPNGDMFIASEAGDRKNGVLLRFNYRGSHDSGQE